MGYEDWTPLHMACARGCGRVALCLLRAGTELHARTGDFNVRSAMLNEFAATGLGHGSKVASAESGINADAKWLDKGLLPIHLAAPGGHWRTVQLLLKHGQSTNATTMRHRCTPLMFAIWSGHVAMVRELLRIGGRNVVNFTDCRNDGSEWTPLSLAVARADAHIVQALMDYGADPLIRLGWDDFPGQAFLRHCSPSLGDGPENRWSGRDSRVSPTHIAVVRGCVEMLRAVLPLVRAAHYCPVRSRVRSTASVIPWQDAAWPPRTTSGGVLHPGGDDGPGAGAAAGRSTSALDSSRGLQDRARDRLEAPLVVEGQDRDPVAFCTLEGWSPAVLAAMLHAVDPARRVRGIALLESLPDRAAAACTRADVFLELLRTGRSLLEGRRDASVPTMPQRFHDVGEALVAHTVDEFVRLCKLGGAEGTAVQVLHTTLCVACRFNRHKVVRHLLESGLCDPRCRFVRPVECRPLHIATTCGFGYLAQLLLEHQADPLERDEKSELPIFKLTRYYARQVSQLQERVADLEAELREARGLGTPTPALTLLPEGGASTPPLASVPSVASVASLTTLSPLPSPWRRLRGHRLAFSFRLRAA